MAANDPAVKAGEVTFTSGSDQIKGYLAQPASGNVPFAAVLVCHQNRGTSPYILDVTRRLAKSGYAALAIDLLSREGGTEKLDRNEISAKLSAAGAARHVGDFNAGLAYLQSQPFVSRERIGMMGFCFGGGITFMMAFQQPALKAAVGFYGGAPGDVSNARNVNAAVLGLYGEEDTRVTGTMPALQKALTEAGKTFEAKVYPGAGHAFHDDTEENPPLRYNPTAAKQAWGETMAWFDKYLRA